MHQKTSSVPFRLATNRAVQTWRRWPQTELNILNKCILCTLAKTIYHKMSGTNFFKYNKEHIFLTKWIRCHINKRKWSCILADVIFNNLYSVSVFSSPHACNECITIMITALIFVNLLAKYYNKLIILSLFIT